MANVPYRQFIITDGTTDTDSGILHAVDLLDRVNGLCITNWQMRVAETKGGGVWADSSLADGRFLKVSKLQNVQEILTVEIAAGHADALADDLHLLYDLLEQARNWGPSGWSKSPVWIEAVGVNESNVRYALVHDYRTPGAGNPFAQPFWQAVLESGISEFEIVLEREPAWRGNYPGDADCVEISGAQEMCVIYPLVFDGSTSFVDLGNPAVLQDLPNGASMTVDAWINAADWGQGGIGVIAAKGGIAAGWEFHIETGIGLYGRVEFATTDAVSWSGTDEFGTDELNGWHHVAMVYDNATVRVYLWIDGTPVASYPTQQVGVGAYVADAAVNGYIGSRLLASGDFDGQIGWVRISSGAFYTPGVAFDPHERCVLPTNPNAEWIGIHEGTGTTIYDMSPNSNNATASNTTWGDCCSIIYGTWDPDAEELEEECLGEFAYVANKHNTIGLTHILVEDGGVFGANLLSRDPPYSLLPAVPAANDRIYFGIATTVIHAGPFCSLMFDLSQAQANIADIDWEYWNGAWTALSPMQDNTDQDGAMSGASFDTTGRKSIHWAQPDDWATSTVDGVAAYWVRAEVQDAGTQPPIQQNRHVYTCLWPFYEIQKDQLNGNIPALARHYLRNQTHRAAAPAMDYYYNRVLIGLRSVNRGEYFSPYLNFSDRTMQNFSALTPGGEIGFYDVGTGATVADTTAPTGQALSITNAGAVTATVAYWVLNPAISEQYQGTFHCYLRGQQTSGAAGDLSLAVTFISSTAPAAGTYEDAFYTTPWVEFETTEDWEVLDFGMVSIDTEYGAFPSTWLTINVIAQGDGSVDATLYDLILLPIDEWAAEAVDVKVTESSLVGRRSAGAFTPTIAGGYGQILNLDNVSDPHKWRTTTHAAGDDSVFYLWQGRAPEGPVLLPDTHQRLWFFSSQSDTSVSVQEQGYPIVCGSVQAWASERYLLMRGDK